MSTHVPPTPATSTPPTPTPPTPRVEPCEVAREAFTLTSTPPIPAPNALISLESVLGAGSLLLSYRYGDQLRFFDAVDCARELLDTNRLCLDAGDEALLNRLYCWPEIEYRVRAATRRRLVATVFGIPNPDGPEDERDTAIQPLLVRLLDAINSVCDPGPFRAAATAADEQRVESAAFAVQARLSLSMTGLVRMKVRDLQRQLDAAVEILTDLATRLQLPCRPGVTAPDLWGSLDVLVGDQLRADHVDVFQEADMAEAWREIFEFLAAFTGDAHVCGDDLCQAAAVLRPPAADCVPVCLPDSVPRQDRLR